MYTDERIPVNFDESTTAIGRDVIPIDVPIVQETTYDYDDMYGVVDDELSGFATNPITVTITEILGGKCRVCGISNEMLLTIHSIHNYQDNKNPKYVKRLVQEVIKQGNDPTKDFCILCYNCDTLMTRIKEHQKVEGLPEFTQIELEQEVRVINR